MKTINANDLKKHGISAAEGEEETLVNVRGKPSHVIVRIDKYEEMSIAELSIAAVEAEADYKAGKYVSESIDKHIKRIAE